MSICARCGESVCWAKRGDGSTHPPLVYVGHGYIVNEFNVAVWTAMYEQHRCDPEVAGMWAAHQQERAEHQHQYRLDREFAWEQALPHACERCGAAPGQHCENLTERRKGSKVQTRWPHPERWSNPERPF